jgi:hypothetical protein
VTVRGFIRVTAAIAIVVGAAAARAVAAQNQPAPPAPAVPEITANEVQRLFDAWALVQAQDALQLSEAQYGKFVTRLKALQEVRRRNQQTRGKILQDLRRLTGPEVTTLDETTIRERLRTLREEEDRNAAELRKAYDAVDELLDIRQQARFRLFEEQVERRKLDLLMRARRNAAEGRRGR